MFRLLVYGESAGRGLLRELCGDLRQGLFECRAIQTGRSEGFPRNLERSGEKGFFFAHDRLNFIFYGGNFRFQLFLHPFEFQQLLYLDFHALIRHCVCLLYSWKFVTSSLQLLFYTNKFKKSIGI